ncbi:MAG TPA: T9SS type A sorting domain-containing protein [Bacteroidia bacterium]|nr:T9SS type A sorting domain-containing protein [Bacteroidia bacterium]HNU33934.1 T9SS type A sorting domain-containing protein [Bacteroidia bacterium]
MQKALTLFIALFVVITGNNTNAQPYAKVKGPKVYIGGNQLPMAWVGGLNAPIFNEVDLNLDGINDLVLFSIQGSVNFPGSHRLQTFINHGTPNQVDYEYAPEYISKFPDVHHWMLMADYNCDGREDIFSYSYLGGMEVYRNDNSIAGGLRFTQVSTLIYSTFGGGAYANLYVAPNSLPALFDVNGDGDIDVLTFKLAGVAVEYHENQSMELYGTCDSLVFTEETGCFGKFSLSAFSNTANLGQSCVFRIANPDDDTVVDPINSVLHSGSCLESFDNGLDGDVDLLNGDILGNNLLYLENGGTIPGVNDTMIYQDSIFPAYDIPVNYVTFPAPYYIDVNNDGKKDLILSGCVENQSENYTNIKLYKNTTNNASNVFNFFQNRFLTDKMIDVGSGANPVIIDVDADGKKDLLIGNYGYLRTNQNPSIFESGISYYRNTGTNICPEFTLINDDYENVFAMGLQNIYPCFGDLDNDGDSEMLLGANDGMLYLYTNNGGAGNPLNLTLSSIQYQGIDVGNAATPQIVDVDKDGLLDLLIGNAMGTLYFFKNTGTLTSPVFTYITDNLGGVNVTNQFASFGYSQPYLYDDGGVYKLLVASEEGRVFMYNNIDGNLTGNFNLITNTAYGIVEQYRTKIALGDLDGDGNEEIIVGNYAGGLNYYTKNVNCFTGIAQNNTESSVVSVYPNPSNGNIVVETKQALAEVVVVSVMDNLGRIVYSQKLNSYRNIIDLSNASNGVYTVRISADRINEVHKVVLKK